MSDQVCGLLSPFLRKKRIAAAFPYLKGKILDFGCGVGALAEQWPSDQYFGVDIDEDSIKVAKVKLPEHRFETHLPQGMRFDTIVMLAVIEHIDNPPALLRILKELLEPKGTIVITTPHPAFEWIHTIGARLGLFSLEGSREHKKLANYETMNRWAQESGFQVTTYRRFLFGANQLFILRVGES